MLLCYTARSHSNIPFLIDLIALVKYNKTIVHIELDGNTDIDPSVENELRSKLAPQANANLDEVEHLIKRVRNNDPTLTELDLRGMNISAHADAVSLFDALAGNSCIQKVDLSSNELGDEDLSSICLDLLENESIKHLNLANNVFSDEGAKCKFHRVIRLVHVPLKISLKRASSSSPQTWVAF